MRSRRTFHCAISFAHSTPATISQLVQYQQQIPTLASLDQSLLIIWPHVVVLVALMVGCFALAYAQFMRQEVRA